MNSKRDRKTRVAIRIPDRADVISPIFPANVVFYIQSRKVDWSHLSNVRDIEKLIGIAIAAGSNRSDKLQFLNNGPRQLFEYLGRSAAHLNESSIVAIRSEVESLRNISANTKYQMFSNMLAVVREAFARRALQKFKLPPGLPRDEPKQKQSLLSIAPSRNEDIDSSLIEFTRSLKFKGAVDEDLKLSIALTLQRLVALREYAAKEIAALEADLQFAESAIKLYKIDDLLGSEYSREQTSLEYCLAWMHANFGRLLPPLRLLPPTLQTDLKRRFGGITRFQRMLAPTSDTLAPFIVLFLANSECSPNVDSVREYTLIDCVGRGEVGRGRVVRFGKVRGGKREFEVEVDASSKYSLPNALQILGTFVQRCLDSGITCSPSASYQGKNRLFLHVDRQKQRALGGLDSGTFADCVRRFLARAAAEFPIVGPIAAAAPENFRPTHGTIETMINGLLSAKKLLHHENLSTTLGYVDRQIKAATVETRIERFHSYLLEQAVSINNSLSIESQPTGLGLFCSKRPEANERTCSKIDTCERDQCSHTRIVVDDPGTAAIWIRMSEHIEEQADDLKRNYPEKLEEVWLPRLALYKTLLAKASPKVKAAAQKLVEASRGLPLPSLI